MKRELAMGFAAAVILHGLVLFGFSLERPAHPLEVSDEAAPVDVNLVAALPEPAPAAAPPKPPAPAEPAPTPEPEPMATPQPTPDMSTPPPEPTPAQETMTMPEATPEPRHAKALPRPSPQHRAGTAMPHTAPGTAGAPAGAAAVGHGRAGGAPSTRASYLSNPRPDYPEEARRERQEGVVVLSVEVGTDGRPSDVTLGRSSGFPMLDQAALAAVRRWRFQPAEAGGLAVESRVEVPVRFSLSR